MFKLLSALSQPQESSSNSITPLVGMSEDGQTVVCWHPEPEHPYEHTQPMEYNKEELSQGTSVLKDQVLRNYDSRVRPTGPNTQELSHITFTTKHRWFPKPGKKFAKRDPPKDRDAI
ncbi:RM42-like protein [Mya arenaria]|uniref:Large ribosomal subunit protein mL42 n=1 Tax=Mya arenaria TaxID=6604 RepID=A0ABY7FX16_MYAAR|nr:RM42-like protein [Mya arenaria]